MDDTANGDATATAPAAVAHSDSNAQPVNAKFSHVSNVVPLATVSGVAGAVATAGVAPGPLDRACVDNGGCMLYAVNKCAGFEALTAEDLDGEIDEVYRTFNNKTEWAPDMFKREWAGTNGESWHFDCIRRALKTKYGDGNFEFKRLAGGRSAATKRGNGNLLVWGKKNRHLWPDVEQGGNWQHALCVATGSTSDKKPLKFFEMDYPNGKDVEMWLNHEKQSERWMTQISRVYQLSASAGAAVELRRGHKRSATTDAAGAQGKPKQAARRPNVAVGGRPFQSNENSEAESGSRAEGAGNITSDSDREAEGAGTAFKYVGNGMSLMYEGPVNASQKPHGTSGKCTYVTFTNKDPRYAEADEITDCEWSNGTLVSGKGTFPHQGRHEQYEGQFICGQFSGYGVNTGYGGNSYRGFWCDGDEDGPGAEYDKDGQFERGGKWRNGNLNEDNTADEETVIQAIKDTRTQKKLGE
jgi:hypothetical protein